MTKEAFDPSGSPNPPAPRPDAEMRRLHPVSLLLSLLSALRGLVLPAVALLVVSPTIGAGPILAATGAFAVVAAVVRYAVYRYALTEDALLIEDGLLNRNARRIPYRRIQNIDTEEGPLHRLFGVAVARIETAGGAEPEAVIRVLSRNSVEEIRRRVLEGGGRAAGEEYGAAGEEEAPAPRQVLSLGVDELALLGVVSQRGLVVLGAGLGLLWQTGLVEERLTPAIERATEALGAGGETAPAEAVPPWLLTAGLAGAVLVLGGLLVGLSMAFSIYRYYGFRLSLEGEDLRVRYGSLTTIAATLPRPRVQRLVARAGPLHRLLRRTSLRVDSAGGAVGESDEAERGHDRRTLAPIAPRSRLPELISIVLPGTSLEDLPWRRFAAGTERRLLGRNLLLAGALSVPILVGLGREGLTLVAAAAVVAVSRAVVVARCTRWALDGTTVALETGFFIRTLTLVPRTKVQVTSVTTTPFDRRRGAAQLVVDTAGAPLGRAPLRVRYADAEAARDAAQGLRDSSAQSGARW